MRITHDFGSRVGHHAVLAYSLTRVVQFNNSLYMRQVCEALAILSVNFICFLHPTGYMHAVSRSKA
jgi:hypothetical protein